LIVCHLNHRLRGKDSDEDARFVRALAEKHHLPCEIARVDVKALAKRKKLSIETAAREARHAFFRRMARKHDTQVVLLAHHAEDQAETILGNMLRGCGLEGLSGMSVETPLADGLTLLRPLLSLRRAQIDAYVLEHGLAYREDGSNASLEHRRNRLRHEALPLLAEIAGRDVVPILNRLGSMAQRDESYLDDLARRVLEEVRTCDGLHELELLREIDAAVLSRVLAIWLREDCALTGIGHEEIQRAMSVLMPGGQAKVNLPAHKHLRRKAGRLWVEG
jgi:tRNA(Ile)-lysidine synthase